MCFYILLNIFILVFITIYVKNKKIKSIYSQINTLQVQDCITNTYSPMKCMDKNKSTFPSFSCNGSLTLETALVLPIFIFAIISFSYFFIILNYQNIMQTSLINTAKSIGRYSYTLSRINEFNEEDIENKVTLDNEILLTGINTGYAWKKILTDEVKNYTKNSKVIGGTSGIVISSSSIGKSKDGINDLKVYYRMQINILGSINKRVGLGNRCYFRNWIGESIVDNTKQHTKTVYITKTGNVYHLTNTCTYIDLSVSKTTYGNIGDLRNSSGGKYNKCERCVKKALGSKAVIYITASGNAYHCNGKCSTITRDVIAIDISEIGDRTLCSRCQKNNK